MYSVGYPDCNVSQGVNIPDGYGGFWQETDDNGCMKPFSPVYFFEKFGDPNFDDIPGTLNRIRASSESEWASFRNMLADDFTESNLRSKILKTSIYAGIPRRTTAEYVSQEQLKRINDGYSISFYNDKETEEEFDHLHHWITEKLLDDFEKNVDKSPYRTLFTVPKSSSRRAFDASCRDKKKIRIFWDFFNILFF